MKRATQTVARSAPVFDSCLTCTWREEGLFCRLPPEALRDLESKRQTAFYPAGTMLFVEGESPRGLFILCYGQAKLSMNSTEGRSVIVRLVEAGEVLGLSSVIRDMPYPVTAETVRPSQVGFVPGREFWQLLRSHAALSARVAEHLSAELHEAWAQTRLLTLASGARAKLAQLLLAWVEQRGEASAEGFRVPLPMTQEEIGETIGTTRETVNRLFSEFKRQRLIRVRGGALLVVRPNVLRVLSAERPAG